jgi:adenylate cyclase
MSATLVDQQTEDRFRLIETTILGRKKDCTLCLPDPRVSRQHAMVRKQGVGEFWFYDLGSINGSYINDERVVSTQQLRHGDVVRISDFQFEFQSDDPEADGDDEARYTKAAVTDIKTMPVLLLVSDLKDFDSLQRSLEPEELAQVIGGWYRESTQALQSHGGTIDQFDRHCVLSYWMETEVPTREKCLESALALQQACRFIEEDYEHFLGERGLSFHCGIALHLGKVAHGLMSDGVYSMMGEPVNVARRLENLVADLSEEIIASADFLNGWAEANALFSSAGRHMIKGRSSPMEIYTLQPDI